MNQGPINSNPSSPGIEQSIKTLVEKNPGFLFLAGTCLASAIFYLVGIQIVLFTGVMSAAVIHTLYPKETEKWLKEHEFLFAGGAFGYLLSGFMGSLVGLWLGYFVGEKYKQAVGIADQVTQAVSPVLHPITFAGNKMRSLTRWLRGLGVDQPAAQTASTEPAQANDERALVVRTPGLSARAPVASSSEFVINFKTLARAFVDDARRTNLLLAIMRSPFAFLPFKGESSRAAPLAIEYHSNEAQPLQEAEKDGTSAVADRALLIASPSVLNYRALQQQSQQGRKKAAVWHPEPASTSGCSMGMQFDFLRGVNNLFSMLSPVKRRPY